MCLIFSYVDLGSQEHFKVLFDEYHTRVKVSIYEEFLSELQDKGYDTEPLKERIDSSLLSKENFDVYVVVTPIKMYTDEELEAIEHFVEEGGGLIILGDGGYWMQKDRITGPINAISTIFGIEFNEDEVQDFENIVEGGNHLDVIISTFKNHPVTRDVEGIGYLYGCSLTLGPSVTGLAFGDTSTTADKKKGRDVIVLAATEYGKGKVLAMGDYDFLITTIYNTLPSPLYFMDDRVLGFNMFEWVTYLPESTPPESTPPEDGGICMGTMFLGGMFVGLIPRRKA